MSAQDATFRVPGLAWQWGAALAGLLALAGCVALASATDAAAVLGSYLIAFIFWLSIPVGSLAMMMLFHLVGGRWGRAVLPALHAAARTLPLLALLVIPILLQLSRIYPWAREGAAEQDDLIAAKSGYLNLTFFWIRALIYFGWWITAAYLLTAWARWERHGNEVILTPRLQRLSAGGLVLHVLTVSVAAVDLGMSLDPHWYSSIYGLLFVMQGAVAGLAAGMAMLSVVSREFSASHALHDAMHDLGNLLLATIALWAYIHFSQYIIIWAGDLPEDVGWYLARTHGDWSAATLLLIGAHFVLPFALLLNRPVKRSVTSMLGVTLLVLAAHLVDVFWMIAPSLGRDSSLPTLGDLLAFVGVGGLWLAVYLWQWRRIDTSLTLAAWRAAHG